MEKGKVEVKPMLYWHLSQDVAIGQYISGRPLMDVVPAIQGKTFAYHNSFKVLVGLRGKEFPLCSYGEEEEEAAAAAAGLANVAVIAAPVVGSGNGGQGGIFEGGEAAVAEAVLLDVDPLAAVGGYGSGGGYHDSRGSNDN